jgi:hypothetical protein
MSPRAATHPPGIPSVGGAARTDPGPVRKYPPISSGLAQRVPSHHFGWWWCEAQDLRRLLPQLPAARAHVRTLPRLQTGEGTSARHTHQPRLRQRLATAQCQRDRAASVLLTLSQHRGLDRRSHRPEVQRRTKRDEQRRGPLSQLQLGERGGGTPSDLEIGTAEPAARFSREM